jgi:MFS family permease
MLRHLYPEPKERALALGVWSAVSGVALSLGPVLGGLLVAWGGWRAVFWFSLAFGVLAFFWSLAVLDESSDPEGRRLDVLGLAVSGASLLALTFAVVEGENVGYGSWWVDGLFAAGLLFAAGFVQIERHSPDPVLKLDFLRLPGFALANGVAFATNFGLLAVFFFTTLYLQLIAGFSSLQIVLQFLSMAATMIVAGLVSGRLTARLGPRLPLAIGCLLGGAGLLLLDALLKPTVSLAALAGPLALAGFGLGMAMVAMTDTVLGVVPAERSGTAASTVNSSRELGGVFAVAVLGSVVNAQLTGGLERKLRQLGIPHNFQQLVVNAVTHGTAVPPSAQSVKSAGAQGQASLTDKVIAAAEHAAGRGIHISLWISAALVLAAGVAALLASLRSRQIRSKGAVLL